ncbi:hypothetical protein BO94DRAFT_132418 [Aspergillus sclerotioniger CBS 115572]|uniref:Uncharacterized protein n=1 Tax=Aspergillus sclerotioniger CBS 115572 TaxID=1450535 RepID=A0A317XC19_9EURO|nr:hypothetical protein BO94DRAFT_132418 [Aspergillus sclerotioniger CBS 115572]PWY95651.1 hypothetical protein BO94DRAFT_132418 [Aspergillus sclerotioniger CBS 115572]
MIGDLEPDLIRVKKTPQMVQNLFRSLRQCNHLSRTLHFRHFDTHHPPPRHHPTVPQLLAAKGTVGENDKRGACELDIVVEIEQSRISEHTRISLPSFTLHVLAKRKKKQRTKKKSSHLCIQWVSGTLFFSVKQDRHGNLTVDVEFCSIE